MEGGGGACGDPLRGLRSTLFLLCFENQDDSTVTPRLSLGHAQRRGRVPASGLGAVQDLERQALEQGRRRGRLLLAGEACDERGRDGGPTGELSLERGHGGHHLRRGAEPQDACFVLVFNGRVTDLREERAQVG